MDKKVALYARVSTERQEQAGTIESQVAELESYAQEQSYQIDAESIFLDQGVSGGCLARPALDRLRDLAYEDGIDVLLCLSPDRLARKYVHQCLLLEEFQRWGVDVQFIHQPDLEDTPQNRLLLGVQGLFAEYERAVMRERTAGPAASHSPGGSLFSSGSLWLSIHSSERNQWGTLGDR